MSTRVLLVDDEKDFVESLAERMELRGMDVSATTSPREALTLAEERSFDAIVLDLQMPEMDGLQMLKILKERNPKLQIILLTGHATVQKGIEAMKMGALDLLEKPTDLETLTAKIEEAHTEKILLVEQEQEEKIKEILSKKGW